MLECKRLCIDLGDGSPALDYRIENGCVESRSVETECECGATTDQRWQRLTPEELSSHVMADTVVAQWLRKRMGVQRLIRACTTGDAATPPAFAPWLRWRVSCRSFRRARPA